MGLARKSWRLEVSKAAAGRWDPDGVRPESPANTTPPVFQGRSPVRLVNAPTVEIDCVVKRDVSPATDAYKEPRCGVNLLPRLSEP